MRRDAPALIASPHRYDSKDHTMGRRTTVFGMLILSVALPGCMSTPQTESMLSAAGFVMRPADTPEKRVKLQALPQGQLLATQRKNGLFYVYADAAGCGCLYVGNPAAYQQYQQIRVANNIAQMQETTAMLNADAMMDWGGAWGPLAPGW
jgi:hypothetical protein